MELVRRIEDRAVSLAERLMLAMEDAKCSIRSLSVRTGIPRSTIQRLRDDQRKLGGTTSTMMALARALHVSPGWLAFGEEPKHE